MRFQKSCLLACAWAAVVCGTVKGGVSGYWTSDDDFYIRISYMVDFDQKRTFSLPYLGLPNDGKMYCVPTSASDLMAYIDRHGFADTPGVDGPGVLDWSEPSDLTAYNTATLYIQTMGDDMNTDPEHGTSNANNQIELAVRNRLPQSLFDVDFIGATTTWAPKVTDIAGWMKQGGLVSFCYGRWVIGYSGDNLLERQGGHCVVMTKVDKRGFMNYDSNEYVINYADPDDDNSNLTMQSPFASRVMTVRDELYYLDGPGEFRLMSKFEIWPPPSDGRHRLIDSVLTVLPKAAWGVYPTPNDMTFTVGLFGVTPPHGGGSPGGLVTQTFPMPGPVQCALMSPSRLFAYILSPAHDYSSIRGYFVSPLDGQTILLDTFPPGTTVAFHRDGSLLAAVNGDGAAPAKLQQKETDPALPRGSTPRSAEVFLPVNSVVGVAFDDAADEALVLGDSDSDGAADTLLVVADPADSYTPVYTTGISIPGGDVSGYKWVRLTAEPGPTDPPGVLLANPETGLVTLFERFGGSTPLLREQASIDLGGPISGLSTGADGHIFVGRDGVIEEYVRNGTGFDPVSGADASPFAGLGMVGDFEISRSRSNFVASLHTGPAWNNIDSTELIIPPDTAGECPADLASPFEILDLSDVSTFVSGFLAQDPIADVNEDGLWDLQDVTLFVNSFLAGCG